MRPEDTPIWIINFNNLDRGFRRLVEWLRSAGMRNIGVLDNASTYPPLLEYYETCDLQIVHTGGNFGNQILWNLGLAPKTRFILTDPDLVPAPYCPLDLIGKMHDVADRFSPAKVGPSLRIDNIPSCYSKKHQVEAWESQFWNNPIASGETYSAAIDTTFALYEPGAHIWDNTHIRLAPPYTFEHVPWYEDSANPSEEEAFYRSTAKQNIINW